jgi:agmatinase
VVGGLTTDRALKIIRGLQGIKLVGMDLVEVAPSYDHAEITSLAGATLGLEMLYLLAASQAR